MERAPSCCPVCGSYKFTKAVEEKSGFSAGKAAAGGLLLGPIGLLAGGLGKKKAVYYCPDCGFSHAYKPD